MIKITTPPSCNFRKSPVGLFCHRVVILCHCILRHPPVTSPTERHPAISRIINLHQLLTVRRIIGFSMNTALNLLQRLDGDYRCVHRPWIYSLSHASSMVPALKFARVFTEGTNTDEGLCRVFYF